MGRGKALGKDPRRRGGQATIRKIVCYYCRVEGAHSKCWQRDWGVVCCCPCHRAVRLGEVEGYSELDGDEDMKQKAVRKWIKLNEQMWDRTNELADAEQLRIKGHLRRRTTMRTNGFPKESRNLPGTLELRDACDAHNVDPRRIRTLLRTCDPGDLNDLGFWQDDKRRWWCKDSESLPRLMESFGRLGDLS